MRRSRRHVTYANVMSTIAVLLALGGTSYAAATLGGADIVDGSLRSIDIANGAYGVRGIDVRDGSLTAADLAPGSVHGSELGASAVAGGDIADGSITGADIGDGAVGVSELADGSVGAGEIVDGSIGTADVSDGSLTRGDFATSEAGYTRAESDARYAQLTSGHGRLIAAITVRVSSGVDVVSGWSIAGTPTFTRYTNSGGNVDVPGLDVTNDMTIVCSAGQTEGTIFANEAICGVTESGPTAGDVQVTTYQGGANSTVPKPFRLLVFS